MASYGATIGKYSIIEHQSEITYTKPKYEKAEFEDQRLHLTFNNLETKESKDINVKVGKLYNTIQITKKLVEDYPEDYEKSDIGKWTYWGSKPLHQYLYSLLHDNNIDIKLWIFLDSTITQYEQNNIIRFTPKYWLNSPIGDNKVKLSTIPADTPHEIKDYSQFQWLTSKGLQSTWRSPDTFNIIV